jgi:aminoglycoside 6'-N-acetyltransferase I
MFHGDENHVQVKIRHARPKDTEMWERMRCDMWPDGREDHGPEIAAFFAGMGAEPEAVLVAEGADGHLVAVAELSIRTDLPSRLGQPVGYVEGLFIVPEARRQGIARSLLLASRGWARQQGCTGFASDRAGRIVIDRTYEKH